MNYSRGWLSLVLLSSFFFSNLLFRWMTATPPPAAAAAAWHSEKMKNLMDWPRRGGQSLWHWANSVTPKKLIPFDVIKSIPINDILFNYLTLRGPNLTLPRNKLWSKARRLWVLCALSKVFIDFCRNFIQLISECSEPKEKKNNNIEVELWL